MVGLTLTFMGIVVLVSSVAIAVLLYEVYGLRELLTAEGSRALTAHPLVGEKMPSIAARDVLDGRDVELNSLPANVHLVLSADCETCNSIMFDLCDRESIEIRNLAISCVEPLRRAAPVLKRLASMFPTVRLSREEFAPLRLPGTPAMVVVDDNKRIGSVMYPLDADEVKRVANLHWSSTRDEKTVIDPNVEKYAGAA